MIPVPAFKRFGLLFTAACVLTVAAASAHGSSPEKPRKNGAATPAKARQKERTATTGPAQSITIKETARVKESIRVQPRVGTVIAIHADTALRRAERFFFGLPESTPYLQDVASPGIRVENNTPFIRRPPLLPKLVTPSDKSATDAANPPPSLQPEGNGDGAESNPKKTMDDVVDFFRDSGDRQGNDKGLGETFDPTFTPAPLPPPTSSATYRRE